MAHHHRVAAIDTHIADGGGTIRISLEASRPDTPDVIDAAALHPDIRAALLRWLGTPEEEDTPSPSPTQ